MSWGGNNVDFSYFLLSKKFPSDQLNDIQDAWKPSSKFLWCTSFSNCTGCWNLVQKGYKAGHIYQERTWSCRLKLMRTSLQSEPVDAGSATLCVCSGTALSCSGEVAPAAVPSEALLEQGGGECSWGLEKMQVCLQQQPGALNGWQNGVDAHRTEQTCEFFGEGLAAWPHYYIWWCQLLILCVYSSVLVLWQLALDVWPYGWSLQRILWISSFTYHTVFPPVKWK